MSATARIAKIYVKAGCPFCLKTRIFLLEAELLDRIELHEFAAGSAEEHSIRSELAPHFEKPSFPTAVFGGNAYVADSDAIIARLAALADVEPTQLPTFQAYATGVMPRLMSMHREIVELKQRLA